ncbi:MAG TPA: PAN domain-containing protein [Xanthobacteraceae bacterium]|jgi:hypothetical protein|nr:PAN domain-containing protein [Xanthobacteraceae bacterium]
MARIFINYRRDDTPGVAGRLFDNLLSKYSREELFMDVDAMKPGIDFAQQLDVQVSQCQVLLAVIGPRWIDAQDRTGKRRLDSEGDYVRIELASALKRDIAVIPVLVDGATMPTEDSLSDDLKPLARRHAIELRHTRFTSDVDAIVSALDSVVPRSRVPWRYIGPGIAVAVIAIAAIFAPKIIAKLRNPAPPIAMTSPSLAPPVAPAPAPAVTPLPSPTPAQHADTTPSAPTAAPTPASAPAVAVPPAVLPPGFKIGEMVSGAVLRGSFFKMIEISADPAACQTACRAETHCVSWTYRMPAGPAQSARCVMKAVIPQEMTDPCCTSGIEREPLPELREPPTVPTGMTGAVAGVELEGGTYRYFGDATPESCQSACRSDTQCQAWDFGRAGVYGIDARCFLKNRPATQVSSPCCIAGFERQEGAASNVGPAPVVASATPAASDSNPRAATGGGLPAGFRIGEIVPDANFIGSVLRSFEMQGDPSACQSACRSDQNCAAWTYLHPRPNQAGHCLLKAVIPEPRHSVCCASGVERLPPPELRQPPQMPADLTNAQAGIDLFGGEYRNFGGPQATPEACQSACKAEGQCLAWTYVRPAVMGPDARCFLKDKPSTLVHSNCCISAVERQ